MRDKKQKQQRPETTRDRRDMVLDHDLARYRRPPGSWLVAMTSLAQCASVPVHVLGAESFRYYPNANRVPQTEFHTRPIGAVASLETHVLIWLTMCKPSDQV